MASNEDHICYCLQNQAVDLFCNTTMFGMQGDATALPASSPKSEGSGYYDNPYDYISY